MPHISVNFFLMGCHMPSSLGWEVSAHMSVQSNDGLRVRNVKMKKILPGQKRGTCTCIYELWGPSVNRFESFFFSKVVKLNEEEC